MQMRQFECARGTRLYAAKAVYPGVGVGVGVSAVAERGFVATGGKGREWRPPPPL